MPDSGQGLLILDTHVWLWLVEGVAGPLSDDALAELERASYSGGIRVSAISVWEVAMLEARGRISLSRPVDEWVRSALRAPGTRLLDLTPEIAVESTRLPGSPDGDPADRILVASARLTGGRLVTCDRCLIAYSAHGHVAVLDARA
jgi:PIN domain nuclease of toxin-antitoxin system